MWLELGRGELGDLVSKQPSHRNHFLFLTVYLFGVTLGDMIEIIGT